MTTTLTVLGASGAWPTATEPSSGFLVTHDGFRLLLDLGYATFPVLQRYCAPAEVDAVLVSHGHPDHCADLNPLLRARALADHPAPPLPLYAPPGALDAVLRLDGPRMLAAAYQVADLVGSTTVGPFTVTTATVPHHVPAVAVRLAVGATVLCYTGDTGPTDRVAALAEGADLLLAEATHPTDIPDPSDVAYLSTAREAGRYAAAAGVGHLMLTHLWPGGDRDAAVRAARESFTGQVTVARSGVCWPG